MTRMNLTPVLSLWFISGVSGDNIIEKKKMRAVRVVHVENCSFYFPVIAIFPVFKKKIYSNVLYWHMGLVHQFHGTN